MANWTCSLHRQDICNKAANAQVAMEKVERFAFYRRAKVWIGALHRLKYQDSKGQGAHVAGIVRHCRHRRDRTLREHHIEEGCHCAKIGVPNGEGH